MSLAGYHHHQQQQHRGGMTGGEGTTRKTFEEGESVVWENVSIRQPTRTRDEGMRLIICHLVKERWISLRFKKYFDLLRFFPPIRHIHYIYIRKSQRENHELQNTQTDRRKVPKDILDDTSYFDFDKVMKLWISKYFSHPQYLRVSILLSTQYFENRYWLYFILKAYWCPFPPLRYCFFSFWLFLLFW